VKQREGLPVGVMRPAASTRARKALVLGQSHDGAYGGGGYVGQESFMTAPQILALAQACGIEPGSRVLDLCCGVGGPALYLVHRLGCRLVGLDVSEEAVAVAQAEAGARRLAQRTRFLVANSAALPLFAEFDAVLLLETMLAIADKASLLRAVRPLLRPAGRFGLTIEVGHPLAPEERQAMPDGDRVWLVAADAFCDLLEASGFALRRVDDLTVSHAAVARNLALAFAHHRQSIAGHVGDEACAGLITSHTIWARWLESGRVRKLAIIAERMP
jgi:cyclopropane fatty-acyl-phospholipid synthase-like methyltransferase